LLSSDGDAKENVRRGKFRGYISRRWRSNKFTSR